MNTTIGFLGTKFQLKLTILNFRMKLTQRGYFQSTKENNENHHRILHIRTGLGSIFELLHFNFSEQISQKKDTCDQNS